ncbi:hypothetical protein HYW55_02090 [Candidatus Gottesmanbacteria bacterium]|nr:hypothetical protein [Candidatus Gottesmanbacteria bacterium]
MKRTVIDLTGTEWDIETPEICLVIDVLKVARKKGAKVPYKGDIVINGVMVSTTERQLTIHLILIDTRSPYPKKRRHRKQSK